MGLNKSERHLGVSLTKYFAPPWLFASKWVTLSVKSLVDVAPSSKACLNKVGFTHAVNFTTACISCRQNRHTLSMAPVAQMVTPLNGLGQRSTILTLLGSGGVSSESELWWYGASVE